MPEIPDRTFPGKVTRLADALSSGTRTLLTEIDVPNPDEALSPGVYCTVELHIPRKVASLIAPSEGIVFNADGLRAAVIENGTAHFHKVTVTRDFGTSVEVSDGVRAGPPHAAFKAIKPAVSSRMSMTGLLDSNTSSNLLARISCSR